MSHALGVSVRVTTEYVGLHHEVHPTLGPIDHHAYAIWLEGATNAPGELWAAIWWLARKGWPCPQCGHLWPLSRPGGALQKAAEMIARPTMQVSDGCQRCQAIVHLDCTEPALRRRMKWPTMYDRRGPGVSEREEQHPRRWAA